MIFKIITRVDISIVTWYNIVKCIFKILLINKEKKMKSKKSVEFGTEEWINKQTWSLCEGGDYSQIRSEIFVTIKEYMSQAMFDSLKDKHLFENKQWSDKRSGKWNIHNVFAEIAKVLLFSFSLKNMEVQVEEVFKFSEIYKGEGEFEDYEITEEFLQGLLIMLSFKPFIQKNGEIGFGLPEYLKEIFKAFNNEIRLMEVCDFINYYTY